jgi:UDP-N-acetyl-D-glucosamine dehydrogenase
MRVGVIGQGYVGTALSEALTSVSHEVTGIETNPSRVLSLKNVGYKVSNDYSELSETEVIVIAVPTPLDKNRKPDLSYIKSATNLISKYVNPNTLVINESTSYPGTLRHVIAPIIGNNCLFASAPERVDPGNEKWNIRNTPRVIGGLTSAATKLAFELYESICDEVHEVENPEIAEASKLFENTFRQVNIALVNEFTQICQTLEIPVHKVLDAAETKPYGFMKFLPGVGVGGHCIPVDPIYLSYVAEVSGQKASFIDLANEVNSNMPKYIVNQLLKNIDLLNKSVQIIGIAYKSNTADCRESPALKLIELLREEGAIVTWHDEYVSEIDNEKSEPIKQCDLAIICTVHDDVDYSFWKRNGIPVFDVSINQDLGYGKFLSQKI